jgi:N6-adenosine-specific RNA methylase IME4
MALQPDPRRLPLDAAAFDAAEAIIARGQQTFCEVGAAILTIREAGRDELRRRGYRTFEDYMQRRWGWSRDYGYKLTQAVEVVQSLQSVDTSLQTPVNEAQARALVPLPVPLRVEVAQQVDFATTSTPELRKIVAQIRAELAARRPPAPPDVPAPTDCYRCLVIDPPWPMEKIERIVRPQQDPWLDYPTLSVEEIRATVQPTVDAAAPDCHLYLWVTHRFLPVGFTLLEAWGVRYECTFTWEKPTGMVPFSSWMRNTELVLFAHRGHLPLTRSGLKLSFEAPARGHSVKPDAFYERVALASPGPRLDMFARTLHPGFSAWGSEIEGGLAHDDAV